MLTPPPGTPISLLRTPMLSAPGFEIQKPTCPRQSKLYCIEVSMWCDCHVERKPCPEALHRGNSF